MGNAKEMQYSEPEPLTKEAIRDRLLRLDRDTRLEFFSLTVEPLEPGAGQSRRHDDPPQRRNLAA